MRERRAVGNPRAKRGVSGEAPPALPVEGVLNQRQNRAKRGVSGEAPPALPVEGVLNQRQNRAKRGVSGEAPQAYAGGGGAEPTAKPSVSEV